jgi:hypothetical protein
MQSHSRIARWSNRHGLLLCLLGMLFFELALMAYA